MPRAGQTERPQRQPKPGSFRELGDSDDDMDPRRSPALGDADGALRRPPANPALLLLPDDHIPSPSFPRPGDPKKKKQKNSNKCKCCERELTKTDKDKSLLSKYVKCSTCKGNVCELCRDLEFRCHECYIEKSVKLDPTNLMILQRETLLRFLDILHYREDDFLDFDKAHLVKQILTRFQVHEMWDPRFHADPLEMEALEKKKAERMAQADVEEFDNDTPIQYSKTRQHSYSSSDLLNDDMQPSYRRQPSYARETESNVGTVRKNLKPVRKDVSLAARFEEPVPLHTITSPKYFEDLSVAELRDILNRYGVDSTGEWHDLKFRVLQLWNSEKERASQAHNQYNFPATSFNNNPKSANLPKSFSLKDIPSSTAIKKLTITQMKTLLSKYNQNPEAFQSRNELEYQVLILWNQAKREALGIQKEKQMPGLAAGARNWKSQENVHDAGNYRGTPSPAMQYARETGGGPRQYGGQQEDVPRDRYSPMTARHQQQQQQQPQQQQRFQRAPLASVGRYEPEARADAKRYEQSPQNARRGEPYDPYEGPAGKHSTLPRRVKQAPSYPEPVNVPLPPPLPPPAPHLLKTLSLHDINKPEEINALSMRQMIVLLEDYSVNTDGANDKAHLEELIKELWFERIMPERNNPQAGRTGINYHQPKEYSHPQAPQAPPLPSNMGFEDQYAAMALSSKQNFRDGDNVSLSTVNQRQYFTQESSANIPAYQPYGQTPQQDRGAVKKSSQEICTVCASRPIDCIILNCGHMVSCMNCVSRLDACPLCHQEILRIININQKK